MNPLFKLFANPTLAQILSLIFLNPEEEFYQLDIARKVQKALIQVQRAVKTLEEIGLIASTHRGRMVYYKAVRQHPAFEDLKRLFVKTIALGEGIHQALQPLQSKVYLAFIFGSVARGDESVDSDIDLCIIADITLKELSKALSPFSRGLQRELNPILFDPDKFQKRISENDPFMLEILQSPKIWIVGNEHECKQMVKGRKAEGA